VSKSAHFCAMMMPSKIGLVNLKMLNANVLAQTIHPTNLLISPIISY